MSYVPFAKNSSGKSGEIKKKKPPSDKVLIAQLKGDSYLRGERFRGSFWGGLGLKHLL